MEHGTINSVYFKNGVPVCDVQATRVQTEYPEVPVMRTHRGMFVVPSEGQRVGMIKHGDDDERFIVSVFATNGDDATPDLDEGDVALQLDAGTKLTFIQNDNGDYDVDLEASGNITIDGRDFDQHTHDYDDDNGTTTTTKTTTGPN